MRQPAQQRDDLGLRQHVERGGRLVEQQQRRRQHQGAGNRHALALPARELMRKTEAELRPEPHRFERRVDPPVAIVEAVDGERLSERARDRVARMERAIGVLEHQLQQEAARPRRLCRERRPVEAERAAGDGLEPGDGAQERGLPRPGCSDDAECRARRHREGHARDHRAAAETDGEIACLDHVAASSPSRAAISRRV